MPIYVQDSDEIGVLDIFKSHDISWVMGRLSTVRRMLLTDRVEGATKKLTQIIQAYLLRKQELGEDTTKLEYLLWVDEKDAGKQRHSIRNSS